MTSPMTYANSRAHLLPGMRNIHRRTQPGRLDNLTRRGEWPETIAVPTGCGKTSVVKAVASHLRLDVYYLALSAVEDDAKLAAILNAVTSHTQGRSYPFA